MYSAYSYTGVVDQLLCSVCQGACQLLIFGTCYDMSYCPWLTVEHPEFVCSTLCYDIFVVVSGIKCLILCCFYESFSLTFESSVFHPLE